MNDYLFPNVFHHRPGTINLPRETRAEWEVMQSDSEWFQTWIESETGMSSETRDRWEWPDLDSGLLTHRTTLRYEDGI